MPERFLRPGAAGRNDARTQRSGNLATHQGVDTTDSSGDGDQERGGGHHEPSHRSTDSRLSNQAREPQSDTADAEKEHTPSRDCDGNRSAGLPAAVPADSHADYGLSHVAGLDRRLQTTGTLGVGTECHRLADDRDAGHAEAGSQSGLCQVRQEELHGLDECNATL